MLKNSSVMFKGERETEQSVRVLLMEMDVFKYFMTSSDVMRK